MQLLLCGEIPVRNWVFRLCGRVLLHCGKHSVSAMPAWNLLSGGGHSVPALPQGHVQRCESHDRLHVVSDRDLHGVFGADRVRLLHAWILHGNAGG
jgi:hypothetical protein